MNHNISFLFRGLNHNYPFGNGYSKKDFVALWDNDVNKIIYEYSFDVLSQPYSLSMEAIRKFISWFFIDRLQYWKNIDNFEILQDKIEVKNYVIFKDEPTSSVFKELNIPVIPNTWGVVFWKGNSVGVKTSFMGMPQTIFTSERHLLVCNKVDQKLRNSEDLEEKIISEIKNILIPHFFPSLEESLLKQLKV